MTVTRGEAGLEEGKKVKGIKDMVTEGDQTLDIEHTM